MQNFRISLLVSLGVIVTACSQTGSLTHSSTRQPLEDPRSSITYQLELLRAGNIEDLRDCFTESLRHRITPELVETGQQEAADYELTDLVASIELEESQGRKTAIIRMRNGRTLTTLVESDGKWLADTVWFK